MYRKRFLPGQTVRINLTRHYGIDTAPIMKFDGKTATVHKVWSVRRRETVHPLYTLHGIESRHGIEYTFIQDFLEDAEGVETNVNS